MCIITMDVTPLMLAAEAADSKQLELILNTNNDDNIDIIVSIM